MPKISNLQKEYAIQNTVKYIKDENLGYSDIDTVIKFILSFIESWSL